MAFNSSPNSLNRNKRGEKIKFSKKNKIKRLSQKFERREEEKKKNIDRRERQHFFIEIMLPHHQHLQ
jgi:uncharacterized protein (DUF305 family)